jgi:dTDP-4-dehydrorhamnose 3,5-epimerase
VAETALPGVFVISFGVHADERGFFVETFNARTFTAAGLPTEFVQDNHSRSHRGVLRGLHFQPGQGKLVRVARGRIFDVAVDVREGSPTFGRWVGAYLDDESLTALWIPAGCAHGFCALSEAADVVYKCTAVYDPTSEQGIRWNDPTIGVEWPVPQPLVSPRDAALPPLTELSRLISYEPRA